MKEIFSLYNQIEIGQNETCEKCIKANLENNINLSRPISIWLKASNTIEDKPKILFVGKTARGDNKFIGELQNDMFRDASKLGKHLFENSSWAYWAYTREIVKRVYGNLDDGLKNTSFTNLIKCNNSDSEDKTIDETKSFCLNDLQIFWKELEVIKPDKVIFYTNNDYDNYISKYKKDYQIEDITNRSNKVKVGAKMMPWWHRKFYVENNKLELEFLRIGHPERKKKVDFINKIVDWINQN